MIKITKNKPYRVNFTYNNKHYSIQRCGELYDEYDAIRCKEDRNFFINLGYSVGFFRFVPNMKKGQTYKDTDLSKIETLIAEYNL